MNPALRTRVLDALFDGEDPSFVAQVTGASEKEVYEIKRRVDRRSAAHEMITELRNAVLLGGWRSVPEAIAEAEKLVDIFKNSREKAHHLYALPEMATKIEAVAQMFRILEDWMTI